MNKVCLGIVVFTVFGLGMANAQAVETSAPVTPIEHLIVVIGENRTFDHLFATYVPRPGQTVDNLRTRGIVKQDGSPGPNFAAAAQFRAENRTVYALAPGNKVPYVRLPPPMSGTAPPQRSDKNGPYPWTPDDAVTGDQVHRFYQMCQQMDCAAARATAANPSGCLADLYPWVETTVGSGSSGKPPPDGFDERSTGEGSNAMGFYNMARGDAPYLKQLADRYALADNFHQAILGGTGPNHVALGTGDALFYSDDRGQAAIPPQTQLENPDPQPGTNNFYIQDGSAGGAYSNCADRSQPGVASILDYLAALPSHPDPKCEAGHYYLLNNRAPGYLADGTVNRANPFAAPPSTLRTIGDSLSEHGITWRYYGEDWSLSVKDPKDPRYCNICNPFQYSSGVMADAAARRVHLTDLPDLYEDIAQGTLPAVSFVKPNDKNDGHPASSKVDLFEAFSRKLIEAVQHNPSLWKHTAILVTFDEGGGYYDAGYVQPLDFFGDGPRIPLIAVSPYSRGGRVVHAYYDHVSILKFIERNWRLAPLTSRSRDNLPNPLDRPETPYVPANSPAIGDLMEMFQF